MNKNQKNTATDNPKFMILEAAPERYIKKTSPTLVALIRAVEGCLAAFLAVRAVGFVLGEFGNWFSGGSISLDRFLRALLPEIPMGTPKSLPLSLEALAETENLDSFLTLSLDGFEGTSTIDSALSTAFVLCILVILITTVVDAVALLLLRFAMRGAAVAKTTQRVLYLTTFLLLPVVIGLLVRFCYNYYTGGILNNLMAGHFPLPILILIYCVPLLILRIRYHKNIYTVLRAVDFEIRLHFKEMAMPAMKFSRNLFLLGLICFVAAVWAGLKLGFTSLLFIALVIRVLKYILIGDSWGNYCRCHM